MTGRIESITRTLPLALFCVFLTPWLAWATARPNILIIMADDIGLECYSHKGSDVYKNPNIDRLAATGVEFRQAYSQPVCTPSRVLIMTCRYNFRNYRRFGELDLTQRDQTESSIALSFERRDSWRQGIHDRCRQPRRLRRQLAGHDRTGDGRRCAHRIRRRASDDRGSHRVDRSFGHKWTSSRNRPCKSNLRQTYWAQPSAPGADALWRSARSPQATAREGEG